jgi:hypothetical protein
VIWLALLLLQSPLTVDIAGVNTGDVETQIVHFWRDTTVSGVCVFADIRKAKDRHPGKTYWHATAVTPFNIPKPNVCGVPGHKGVIIFWRRGVLEKPYVEGHMQDLLDKRQDLGFAALLFGVLMLPDGYRFAGYVSARLTPWGLCEFRDECRADGKRAPTNDR